VEVQSNSFELGLLSWRRPKSDSMVGQEEHSSIPSHEPKHGAVFKVWLLASCNFGPKTDALAKVVDELNALQRCSF